MSSLATELYVFALGPVTYTYTSADQDIVVNNVLYSALYSLSRSSLSQSSEVMKTTLKITMGRDCPVADLFRVQPPSQIVTVKLFQTVGDDPSVLPGVVWMGRIIQAEWTNDQAMLTADPSYSALQRMGLRRCWQLSCPHVLFGQQCGAPAGQFQVAGTLTGMSSNVDLVIGEAGTKANGYFNGGYVQYTDPSGVVDRRMIVGHTGSVVTIERQMPQMPIGAQVLLLPGCAHNMNDCGTKFNNLLNYGGTPYIPQKNPFDSNPIF